MICGPGVKFNLINASALIIAIPTAVFCKLAGIKIDTADAENAEPAWWFYVKTWAGLVVNGIQMLATAFGVAVNWVTSLDESGEAGKGLSNIISGFNVGIMAPINLFLSNPYLFQSTPQTDIALADWIATQVRWWTQTIDCLIGQGMVLLGGIIPALANKIIAVLIFSVAFWIYLVESFAMMIIEIIRYVGEGDGWKVADSIFALAQNTLYNFRHVYVNLGNAIPVVEEISAIG